MNIINHNQQLKWESDIKQLPKDMKKCDHQWRPLVEGEGTVGTATHECVLCGLEKDTSWEPVIYCYVVATF